MSASLVGSEMCIRDSAPTATDASLRRQGLARCWPTSCPPQQLRVARCTCLLYTSDAADDM
eukprot:6350063-Alexandrium_andersonii.AAC.1